MWVGTHNELDRIESSKRCILDQNFRVELQRSME